MPLFPSLCLLLLLSLLLLLFGKFLNFILLKLFFVIFLYSRCIYIIDLKNLKKSKLLPFFLENKCANVKYELYILLS